MIIRYIIIGLCIWGWVHQSYGQQDAQYTQFMFNRLYYNPAYAGNEEALALSAIYRNQWIGIDGAPETATFNIHGPVWKKRIGLGLSVTNDRIGLTNRWAVETNYSYRIALRNESVLSLGIRASIYSMQILWNNARPTDVQDMRIPGAAAQKTLPNFGAGAFFKAKNGYVGISVPHIFRTDLDLNNTSAPNLTYIEPKLEPHFYLMGGLSFDIAPKVKIQPNLLLKYVANAPFDMDINLSFVFFDVFLAGLTYRLNDSLDGLIMWKALPQLKIGFAYDMTLTQLRQFNSGSVEAMVAYTFIKKAQKMHNPRFFF